MTLSTTTESTRGRRKAAGFFLSLAVLAGMLFGIHGGTAHAAQQISLAGQDITIDGDVMVMTIGGTVYVLATGDEAYIWLGDNAIELQTGESVALTSLTNLDCQAVEAIIEAAGSTTEASSECTGYGDAEVTSPPDLREEDE